MCQSHYYCFSSLSLNWCYSFIWIRVTYVFTGSWIYSACGKLFLEKNFDLLAQYISCWLASSSKILSNFMMTTNKTRLWECFCMFLYTDQNFSIFVFCRKMKVVQLWNKTRVSKWWNNYYFWVNFPFKCERIVWILPRLFNSLLNHI